MGILERLNDHDELFLLEVGEPNDNVLRLVISEAGVIEDVPSGVNHPTSSYRLISAFEGAARYEIIFDSYVAYAVRNESFTVRDDDEKWTGRLFCVYERSRFLEFIHRATIASDEHPGPFIHFGFNCANHVVDIAAVGPPIVRVLSEPKDETPDMDPPPPSVLRCSFCNKSQHDVKSLIAGPHVQICDECVGICVDILIEDKKESSHGVTVDGAVEPAGRNWPTPGTLLLCGLCRTVTTPEQSVALPDRGIICAGCVGAFEAALAEREAPS